MTKIAAVQAAYVLMDQQATLAKAVDLIRQAAADGADIVVLPEAFIPGTPIWIDSVPIWDGDEEWYALLVEQAVTVPGPVTESLGEAARESGAYVVVGVEERDPHGSTIYNTTLYLGPDGALLGKHRKLMPTGSERTVWGMGDGSTLPVIDTPFGRLSGLTCWENYMPLARFHLYAQGVDIWTAPTLASGDAWVATMRHIAREGRCYVVGVNPCVHVDQIPADFPHRDRVWDRAAERRVGRAGQLGDRGSFRSDPGWPGPGTGDHPHRRDRPHRRSCRSPVLRSDRPLQPARRVPADRRCPTPAGGDLDRVCPGTAPALTSAHFR